MIEVKGLATLTGTILLTPNERRVAEDRPDCCWLYVVTDCRRKPVLQEPIPEPARFPWREVSRVQHYYLPVDAMTEPMRGQESRSWRKDQEESVPEGPWAGSSRTDTCVC